MWQNEEDVYFVARGDAATEMGSEQGVRWCDLGNKVEHVWKGCQHLRHARTSNRQSHAGVLLSEPHRIQTSEGILASARSQLNGRRRSIFDNTRGRAASVTFENDAAVVSIGHDGQDPYLQVNRPRADDDYDDIAGYPFVRSQCHPEREA